MIFLTHLTLRGEQGTIFSIQFYSSGFSGKNCEVDDNECDSSPCQNGAFCIDGVNDYKCNCKEGFKGKNPGHDRKEAIGPLNRIYR